MTALDTDTLRHLDALNLIEAITKNDIEGTRQVMAVYARASLRDDGMSSAELASCCAELASLVLQHLDGADQLIAKCRQKLLNDEVGPA